jgi:hypothetical protein
MKRFLMILFMLSCSSSKTVQIDGFYYRMFHALELKTDSTFSYTYRLSEVESKAFGNWRSVDGNKIILNSQIDVENLPLNVKESKRNINDKVISLDIDENFSLDLIHNIEFEVIINKSLTIRSDSNIINVKRNPPINTIKINIYYIFKELPHVHTTRKYISTKEYNVSNSENNYFDISFPFWEDMFLYETIKHDTLEIKGDKLYWDSKGKPKFKRRQLQ